MNYINLIRKFCKIHGFFNSRISASDNCNNLVFIKCSVTYCAITYTSANKLSFTGNAARSSGTSTAAASDLPECMMRKRLMCQNL